MGLEVVEITIANENKKNKTVQNQVAIDEGAVLQNKLCSSKHDISSIAVHFWVPSLIFEFRVGKFEYWENKG